MSNQSINNQKIIPILDLRKDTIKNSVSDNKKIWIRDKTKGAHGHAVKIMKKNPVEAPIVFFIMELDIITLTQNETAVKGNGAPMSSPFV